MPVAKKPTAAAVESAAAETLKPSAEVASSSNSDGKGRLSEAQKVPLARTPSSSLRLHLCGRYCTHLHEAYEPQFPKPVLQRALRKQKKKQNERLVRSTLASSAAAAAKPEGNSSGSEEDLTVECVRATVAPSVCGAFSCSA